jgi:putative serine protease PepD
MRLQDVSRPPPTRYNRGVDPPVTQQEATARSAADERVLERQRWRLVVVLALVVGLGAGGGAGVLVMQTVRSHYRTVVSFSPNLSVFSTIPDVPGLLPKVLPAVVAVRASRSCATASGTEIEHVEGSGMILTPDGEVLTNNHVVSRATSITVTISGQVAPQRAILVGADPSQDVAVLRVVGAANLPVVHFGSSAQLQVGDPVLAIGNALALSNTEPSVTEGIISAEGRVIRAAGRCETTEELTGLLQTQAAINPGNSGGPLVSGAGLVVGMNTASATGTAGNPRAENIGFAIPIDTIEALLPGLERSEPARPASIRAQSPDGTSAPVTTGAGT